MSNFSEPPSDVWIGPEQRRFADQGRWRHLRVEGVEQPSQRCSLLRPFFQILSEETPDRTLIVDIALKPHDEGVQAVQEPVPQPVVVQATSTRSPTFGRACGDFVHLGTSPRSSPTRSRYALATSGTVGSCDALIFL